MSTVSLASQASNKLVATCPACQTRFRIKPYMSGRKAKCGKCQTRMRIPTLRARISEVASTARQRIATVMPGVRGTGAGLLLGAWGMVMMMMVATAAITISLVAPAETRQFQYYLAGGLAAGALLSLAGLLACGCAPKRSGARGWITSAILFCILNMAIVGYAVYCSVEGVAMIVPELALNLTVAGIGTLGFFCYMFFVKNTARFSRRPELAATARGIMWFQLVIISVVAGTYALAASLPATESTAMLLQGLGIGTLVASVVNQIILVVLQFQLGSHLRRRVA